MISAGQPEGEMAEVHEGDVRGRLIALVERIVGAVAVSPFPVNQQLSELGLSSIKMVNLMLAVELDFDVVIPQSEITPENFHSLASIEALLGRLRT
jgi:acyl carrier protein